MKYITKNKNTVSGIYNSIDELAENNLSDDEILEVTDEELQALQIKWRDIELSNTDYIIPITDHSLHSAYITYRQELRDWPSTSDFPNTKPTL